VSHYLYAILVMYWTVLFIHLLII